MRIDIKDNTKIFDYNHYKDSVNIIGLCVFVLWGSIPGSLENTVTYLDYAYMLISTISVLTIAMVVTKFIVDVVFTLQFGFSRTIDFIDVSQDDLDRVHNYSTSLSYEMV